MDAISDFIVIVAGLPRSGTSMMMQMIDSGGKFPALTDNLRKADADNPLGYYEFEAVKQTREDPSWLNSAAGRVVKMVYRLLYDLPADRQYRLVFMRREIDEVLASQNKMLERIGQPGAERSDESMAQLFQQELRRFDEWVQKQQCFSLLSVNYRDVVRCPLMEAERISAFLGGGLDTKAMASVVDPSLYRQRG